MMMENKPQWLGFTLIEMLLVLVITSLIVLIPSLKIPNMERNATTVFFFEELERLMTVTQESAVFSGRASRIVMKKNTSTVMFDYVFSSGQKAHYTIEVPSDVTIQSDTFLTFLGETGNLSKVTALKFLIKSSQTSIIYQYYLGSGKFVKKESTT